MGRFVTPHAPMGVDFKCIINAILWTLVLVFIAWPVSCFCAGWYILLSPFAVIIGEVINPCKECLGKIINILHTGVCWPESCAHCIWAGSDSYEKIGCCQAHRSDGGFA